MTRGGARGAAAALALTVIAFLAVAILAACAPTPPVPSRSAPNDIEKAAVSRTTEAFVAETGDTRLNWVQLWTVAQFPTQMQNCAADESNGQLSLTFGLPGLSIPSYRIVGSGSEPNEAEAARIIERCAAATPLDERALRLPPDRWDALYSYELTTLRPCLLAHGYPVRSMPSRTDFESRLRTEQPSSPYDTVVVPTRAAWYALSDACPAMSVTLNSQVSSE